MRELHWTRRLMLKLPREEVWRLASDTARFNRAVGLPPITFRPMDDRGPGHLLATTRYLGIPLRWHEHPFDWVYQENFSVLRSFKGTPLRSIRISTRLQDRDGGRTAVEVQVDIVPRSLFGWLASRALVGTRILGAWARVFHAFEATAASEVETFPNLGRPVVRLSELQRRGEGLRRVAVDQALVDRLLAHLAQAPDDAVMCIRPFALAARWAASRQEVLRLCLHATRAGLLELSWEILCPNCKVSKAHAYTLAALPGTAHCETCHIAFDANFDEYVELRFAVSPAVRVAGSATYCIGGPGNARHVLAQRSLPARATEEIGLLLRPGTYRVRAPGLPGRAQIEVTPGADTHMALSLDGDDLRPATGALAPGRVTLAVHNAGAQQRLLLVEQASWSADYASAALVTSLQEFRDLFSTEVLAPGLSLGIRNLAILFTDLKGSTAMYERIGDAPAFARVRDHFAVLTEAIGAHDGALVKTIGDAVMAVFCSPAQAVAAALVIHEGIGALNARNPQLAPLQVKVGVHCGPCVAVTANGVLDYFGTTVNTAARVQGVAGADEVVLTPVLLEVAEVLAFLAARALQATPFTAELHGLSGALELYRLRPALQMAM